MNQSLDEHLKRLNPTGADWADLTEEQQLELRKTWDAVVSDPKNLDCTCPRIGCRNNRNCKFCVGLHRYYGGLADCLRFVDDKISEGVPADKRYNIHGIVLKGQQAQTREEYEAHVASAPPDPERMMALVEEYHRVVRVPKNIACTCPRTDCWYHNNCVKCAALHRYYDGFPDCCKEIHDKIDAAVQAYKQSVES